MPAPASDLSNNSKFYRPLKKCTQPCPRSVSSSLMISLFWPWHVGVSSPFTQPKPSKDIPPFHSLDISIQTPTVWIITHEELIYLFFFFYFGRDTFLTKLYWVTWWGEFFLSLLFSQIACLPPWLSKHNLCTHLLQSIELEGLCQWLIFINGQ